MERHPISTERSRRAQRGLPCAEEGRIGGGHASGLHGLHNLFQRVDRNLFFSRYAQLPGRACSGSQRRGARPSASAGTFASPSSLPTSLSSAATRGSSAAVAITGAAARRGRVAITGAAARRGVAISISVRLAEGRCTWVGHLLRGEWGSASPPPPRCGWCEETCEGDPPCSSEGVRCLRAFEGVVRDNSMCFKWGLSDLASEKRRFQLEGNP